MKKRIFEMECPHCHHQFMMVKDTYLQKDLKSADYRHLKDQTFFAHQCQHCHELFELSYPLLYWDQEKNFTVVLTQKKDLQNLDGSISIVCRKPEQFLFAFQCLDLGLDLKKTLLLKQKTEEKFQRKCVLTDYDQQKNCVCFRSGQGNFWVVYDDLFSGFDCKIKNV